MLDIEKLRCFLFLGEAGFASGFADEAHCAVEGAVVAEVWVAGDALADFYAFFVECGVQTAEVEFNLKLRNKSSPPYEGGVAIPAFFAGIDGVVFSSRRDTEM